MAALRNGKIEGRELNRLWGWVDADIAADLDTRRYVIMMNGGSISWKICEAEECVSQDSRAVIAMAEKPSNRKGARHIDAREHFVD
jgi:hypothetical protein